MKKNKKGFTLAELLIVVAIIAVLVAISIPIFTSQLEKAREATDAANIRAAYAELSSDAITGEDVTAKDEGNIKIQASTGDEGARVYTAKITLTQKKAGWTTDNLKTGSIGGISAGSPKEGEKVATLTIHEDGSVGSLTYGAD